MPATGDAGRGAISNPAGRFEKYREEAFDDGWGEVAEEDAPPPLPQTELIPDRTRTIIATNDSPDIPFNRSVNPYRGCEHGCIYCFARPTHSYLGFSAGLDFETRIVFKPEAAKLLREELGRRRYQPAPLALGSNTDPWQPVEADLRITRSVLEVLRETGHPVGIVTKSAMILRDLDIIAPMAEQGLAQAMISITTLRPDLARSMEPRAAAPGRRLAAIRTLAAEGVPVGALASPMIPGLNDAELDRILEAAKDAGARFAGTILLRLPHEVKELFTEWLEARFPSRASHVLRLIRETRDGNLTSPKFGERMRGTGPYADMLMKRFRAAVRRLGFERSAPPLRTDRFRRPGAPASLF